MSFSIPLRGLHSKDKSLIRRDFTVKKNKSQFVQDPEPLECFIADRSLGKVFLPLGKWDSYYEEFPHDRKKYPSTQVQFQGKLYSRRTDPRGIRDQNVLVQEAISQLKQSHTCFIAAHTGYGKCLEPGTEVLMFNGVKKKVEDIVVGDLLMGDDSTPRSVLSITSGEDEMYKIIPKKGESFSVNKHHVLSLKASGQGRIAKSKGKLFVRWFDGKKATSKSFSSSEEAQLFSQKILKELPPVFDIPLDEYLKFPVGWKHVLKLFWAPTNYPERPVPIDPYILGLWLGDGHREGTRITNVDSEIIEYCESYAKEIDMEFKRRGGSISYAFTSIHVIGKRRRNRFLGNLRSLNLIKNKHIPQIYKTNSKEIRLRLLAGLVDSDGFVSRNCYEITQKRKGLAHDIVDLCRSLGFAAFVKECQKSCIYLGEKKTGTYHRVLFYGAGTEDIPVLSERKKSQPRKQVKNALVTSFKVQPLGKGKYHGFELDGNGRFLLGSYIVTHNTSVSIYLLAWSRMKAVVLVFSDLLQRQWKKEIEKFTTAKVQLVKNSTAELDPTVDIYVIGVKRASMMDRLKFKGIGMVVLDEAHIATETGFCQTLLKFEPYYLIGATATPSRPDGLHKIFYLYFGASKNFIVREERNKRFRVIKYQTPYKPTIKYRTVYGKLVLDWSKVQTSIASIPERQAEIVDIILKNSEEKIMVLSARKNQSNAIHRMLLEKGEDVELLIGTKKVWDRDKRILVAGMKKAGVGFDDPKLTMLILASDVKNVRQYEGRLRTDNCLIYDIVDNFSTFDKHWELREKWYLRKGGTIEFEGSDPHENIQPSRRFLTPLSEDPSED